MDDLKSVSTSRILTPQERRQRNRDEMTAAILETARQIMRQDGVGALNLHEIARQIGLRTSSLYVYFPNKMAIYDALFLMGVRLYREEIQRLIQTLHDPWEILEAIFEGYMSLALQNPELYQLVFERPVPGFVPSEASMAEMLEMEKDMFVLMNQVIAVSNVPEAELQVHPAHGLIIAMMHGLTALHMANDPELPVGSGRFGSLTRQAVALFKAAWGKNH